MKKDIEKIKCLVESITYPKMCSNMVNDIWQEIINIEEKLNEIINHINNNKETL